MLTFISGMNNRVHMTGGGGLAVMSLLPASAINCEQNVVQV